MIVAAGKRLIYLWAIVSVVCCVFSACADPAKLPTVSAKFVSANRSDAVKFDLEVCSNDRERALGLMYRRSLPEFSGMLFVFPVEQQHSFWMKNTYIPLDMVFLDSDMKVVGILENVPPLTEAPRSVRKPSQFVVELGAGITRKHGVTEGARMEVEGVVPAGQ